MSKLEDIVPEPGARRPIYQVFAAIGLVIGAVQVAFASVPDLTQPVWLTVSLSVYAFLGAAGFTVAQANTNTVDEVSIAEIPITARHADI